MTTTIQRPSLRPANAPAADNKDGSGNTMNQVKQLVSDLRRSANEINGIVGAIRDVAKHTNLVALNAAIEAARAGEHGRGFAVVADEVRALAQRTTNATGDISRMVKTIEDETAGAVQGVEQAERDSLLANAQLLASLEASRLETRFARLAATMHGLKRYIEGLKHARLGPDREALNAVMASYLNADKDVLAYSCCIEPNALDGRDAEFANTPGHDHSGRFIAYWNRGNGVVALEPLADYDKPGQNDWYELPRRAGHDIMMEPYDYRVSGRVVRMTSLMVVLKFNQRFAGTLGGDFSLDNLQAELSAHKPLKVGFLALISNAGAYVTHPEAQWLGKPASDLSSEARQAVRNGAPCLYVDTQRIARVFCPVDVGIPGSPWSLMVSFGIDAALDAQCRQAPTAN